MKFKFILKLLGCTLFLFIIIGFINPLSITRYNYTSQKLPSSFDGYKILQLSDFHCKSFGKDESKLISKIHACQPDIILFTGDMVDEDHSIHNFELLVKGIYDIAPIYAVTGNHDTTDSQIYTQMMSICEKYNIHFLDSTSAVISSGNNTITLCGTNYTSWYGDCMNAPDASFNILLYHDSNAFPTTSTLGYQIIFSGHSHGGILRLPFIGGLISNNHSLFPTYDGGVFESETTDTIMYSSRGLGDSKLPRFYNSPELVLVTLHSK